MPISISPSYSTQPPATAKLRRRIIHRCMCVASRQIFLAATLLLFVAIPFRAQEDRPLLRVQDDCTAFGYAPDGRIAYSTRQIFHVKKATYERDDIWIVTPNGGKRRLIEGAKFIRGDAPFSYAVRAFRWSPDSKQLAVELFMTKFTNAHGDVVQGAQTLLLDDTGREIKVPGLDSLVPGATDAQWLSDDDTIVYLTQAMSAVGPYTVKELHTTSGTATPLFEGHGFVTVAWSAQLRGRCRDRSD